MNEIQVTEKEFYDYVDHYYAKHGIKLEPDCFGACEPPLITYNDYTLGMWPDSVVARTWAYGYAPIEERKYYIKDETKAIQKIKPKAQIEWDNGNDGRDGRYFVAYYCPTCNKCIGPWKQDVACINCGTFFDWGKKPAEIKVTRSIDW